MNLNFEKARNLMVENQLRPSNINDSRILNLFRNIKKEDFLLDKDKSISYHDSDINIIENRGYLKNLNLAQLITNAKINKSDLILHLGGLTGYVSVILAQLSKKIIVLENEKGLIDIINKNIKQLEIDNIEVIESIFSNGYDKLSPYDLIFIDNPIDKIPDSIKEQLSSNYGKIIMLKKTNNFFSQVYKITRINNDFTEEFLFDVSTKFLLYKKESEFIF
tara:strand:+ start:190 stop:849 length:660 start_codon:yes stop_codon:yes gene_type:complete